MPQGARARAGGAEGAGAAQVNHAEAAEHALAEAVDPVVGGTVKWLGEAVDDPRIVAGDGEFDG